MGNKFDKYSGHYKQDFLGKKRINLHSGSDKEHGLNAVLLPRGMTTVDKDKIVQFTIHPKLEPEKYEWESPKPETYIQKILEGLKTLPKGAKPAVLLSTGGLSPVHKTH